VDVPQLFGEGREPVLALVGNRHVAPCYAKVGTMAGPSRQGDSLRRCLGAGGSRRGAGAPTAGTWASTRQTSAQATFGRADACPGRRRERFLSALANHRRSSQWVIGSATYTVE